jgi:hypothetical protein
MPGSSRISFATTKFQHQTSLCWLCDASTCELSGCSTFETHKFTTERIREKTLIPWESSILSRWPRKGDAITPIRQLFADYLCTIEKMTSSLPSNNRSQVTESGSTSWVRVEERCHHQITTRQGVAGFRLRFAHTVFSFLSRVPKCLVLLTMALYQLLLIK